MFSIDAVKGGFIMSLVFDEDGVVDQLSLGVDPSDVVDVLRIANELLRRKEGR